MKEDSVQQLEEDMRAVADYDTFDVNREQVDVWANRLKALRVQMEASVEELQVHVRKLGQIALESAQALEREQVRNRGA